jgi:hydroxymethylbilane synthase
VTTLRLGTRGSQLALYQARTVAALVAEAAGVHCELVIIRTSGDSMADRPVSEAGGKRLFVKEIEDALLAGTVDVAVHSSKDLPAELPDGLEIGAVLPRDDPADVLVQRGVSGTDFDTLARQLGNARIGTGSIRRIAQLRRVLPDGRFEPIRGNLDTRLRKLDSGDYDVLVLAAAGMRRLNLAERISAVISPDICVPAPGQGIIAIEIRADDARTRAAVAAVDDPDTAVALRAERALVVALGGGCQMPIGGLCRLTHGVVDLIGVVASLDGSQLVRHRKLGPRQAASDVGRDLGEQLLRDGAAEILAEARAEGSRIADPHGP